LVYASVVANNLRETGKKKKNMALIKSSNPALSEKAFRKEQTVADQGTMTIGGAINKSFILLFLIFVPASWAWNQVAAGVNMQPYMMGGIIGGLIFAIITIFKKEWAPVTAPLYALAEGLFLGSISYIFNDMMPGIAAGNRFNLCSFLYDAFPL
jgi:uncharacterized YccA/Bax inhibitor family protein